MNVPENFKYEPTKKFWNRRGSIIMLGRAYVHAPVAPSNCIQTDYNMQAQGEFMNLNKQAF